MGWSCWGAHLGGQRPSSDFRAGSPEAEGRKQEAWEAGGRDRQAGLPSPVGGKEDCLMPAPGDQARRRKARGFPGQNFGSSKREPW